MRLRNTVAKAVDLYRLPEVKIQMRGDARAHDLHASFTRRHPRYRLIQNKSWGVALLPIPCTYDAYFMDPRRAHLRKELRRAVRAGFVFARFDPRKRVDEILAINVSTDSRQGRAMHRDYADPEVVRRYLDDTAEVWGIFDRDGVLRAYFCGRYCGPVLCGERILGHTDYVQFGIMYLLVAEIVRELTSHRNTFGEPEWLYYDTFPGASPGMRDFKRWIGCEPFRVRWSWRNS